jgi:hypothetical protein
MAKGTEVGYLPFSYLSGLFVITTADAIHQCGSHFGQIIYVDPRLVFLGSDRAPPAAEHADVSLFVVSGTVCRFVSLDVHFVFAVHSIS